VGILFLDFETYYAQEYSLSHMTPPEYILDPRFETIGCAVKRDNEPSFWVDGPDFAAFLKTVDPEVTTTVTFNALFDNCILAWRYGFVPARMLCSMRMAATLRGHMLDGVSLKKVAATLKLGVKGDTIANVRGMRRMDIMSNPALWAAYQAYANNDNELSAKIFDLLLPEFPHSERKVMDKVLRCAVVPKFEIDEPMLKQHLGDLQADKVKLLEEAAERPLPTEADQEAFAKNLRSSALFETLLKARGVDIEYKPSQTGGPDIPAFAKTDEFMSNLLENEDPVVASLAEARLGVRSTIEESRGERILRISGMQWPSGRPLMPIPLRYSGAHTHRLSGDWLVNMQNLPSGRGAKKSKLRKALIAPVGHKVVVADLAQIECRINAWLCGQKDLLEQFANGQDPYALLASHVFGFAVDKKVHLLERFIGKAGVLGLGFYCGATKFYNMVLRSARSMGMDMTALLKVWNEPLAQRTVYVYRNQNRAIVNMWKRLEDVLDTAWSGNGPAVKVGPCIVGHGYVEGPLGLRMKYMVLPKRDHEWYYRYGNRVYKMYSGKFLENLVQFLARIVIMHAALRISDRGYTFALQSHDELAFIVRDEDVDNAKKIVYEEMTRRPSWAPDLPLQAEVGGGQSYGDAK